MSGQGFLVDLGAARQRIEMMPRGAAHVPSFIYETTLTPVTTGKLTVFAQGFTAGSHFSGPIVITGPATISGGPPQYTLLESDPVELNVRPLPREGELPGFTGAIGSFAVGPPKLATNVLRVGDPVKLTVTITNRGDGPLARLVAPPPPQVRDWQVFAATDFAPAQPRPPVSSLSRRSAPAADSGRVIEGVVTFNYTLIPLTEAARATPPIPFSYFDPKAAATPTSRSRRSPSRSNPAPPPPIWRALAASRPGGRRTGEGTLCSAAWPLRAAGRPPAWCPRNSRRGFRLIQLAPAAAFFGLWSWDRRRRYLEQHPDILLRRRARRALHRQRRILQRAARAADAPRFAAAAVSAMRVACAPHYPAEPRALVGADVLPLLPEPDRSGRRRRSRAALLCRDRRRPLRHRAPKRRRPAPPPTRPGARAPAIGGEAMNAPPRPSEPWCFVPRPSALRISAFLRPSDFGLRTSLLRSLLLAACVWPAPPRSVPDALFQAGVTAYRAGDYAQAAEAFRQSVALQPASGALQNLGNAEWQRHRTGAAILAWEQALWLDPFNESARQNLRFARKTAQLEAPDLAWYEVISTWLPVSWWAWIAGGSLWLAVGMGMLPGILRRRKATWHQAIAALGAHGLPAQHPGALFGVADPLADRLCAAKGHPPAAHAHARSAGRHAPGPGEPARWVRARGHYVLIRTSRTLGWVEQDQFGLTCPKPGRKAGQRVKVTTAR